MRKRLITAAAAALLFGLVSHALAQNTAAQLATLKVVLLGTGGGPPMDLQRYGPSTLVEAGGEKLLFDCGREATLRMAQYGIRLGEVSKVFVTHLHSDHVIGIPDLFLTPWASEEARRVPFEVWGPPGTREMMDHMQKAFAFDIRIRRDVDEKYSKEGITVSSHDIKEGVVFEKNGVKVTAFLVDHRPVKPAFGYRVDYAGHSVALSGDTRFSENLIKFSQGVDVLIHEGEDAEADRANPGNRTHEQMENIIAHHTSLEQAGVVFSRVKPRLAVYSHVSGTSESLVAGTRKTYSGPLEGGEDLMTIEIGEKIEVRRFTP
jgi:ribonuclease Z